MLSSVLTSNLVEKEERKKDEMEEFLLAYYYCWQGASKRVQIRSVLKISSWD